MYHNVDGKGDFVFQCRAFEENGNVAELQDVAIADLDADGMPDLVLLQLSNSYFLANGPLMLVSTLDEPSYCTETNVLASFHSHDADFPAGDDVLGVVAQESHIKDFETTKILATAMVDFDGDGDQDVMVHLVRRAYVLSSDRYFAEVALYRNDLGVPPPFLSPDAVGVCPDASAFWTTDFGTSHATLDAQQALFGKHPEVFIKMNVVFSVLNFEPTISASPCDSCGTSYPRVFTNQRFVPFPVGLSTANMAIDVEIGVLSSPDIFMPLSSLKLYTSTCTFVVNVTDREPPRINQCPDSQLHIYGSGHNPSLGSGQIVPLTLDRAWDAVGVESLWLRVVLLPGGLYTLPEALLLPTGVSYVSEPSFLLAPGAHLLEMMVNDTSGNLNYEAEWLSNHRCFFPMAVVELTASSVAEVNLSLAQGTLASVNPLDFLSAATRDAVASSMPAGLSWSMTDGQLPLGVSFDGASAEFIGTPQRPEKTMVTMKLCAPDLGSTACDVLPVHFTVAAYRIEWVWPTNELPAPVLGEAYSFQPKLNFVAGGTQLQHFELSSSQLPDGLQMDSFSGVISGVATMLSGAPSMFTIKAIDASGAEAAVNNNQTFVLTVIECGPSTCGEHGRCPTDDADPLDGRFRCVCNAGYGGQHCQTTVCAAGYTLLEPTQPCVHCGPGHYVPPGTSGPSCDFYACPEGTVDDDGDPATPCKVIADVRSASNDKSLVGGLASSLSAAFLVVVVVGALYRRQQRRLRLQQQDLQQLRQRVKQVVHRSFGGKFDVAAVMARLETPRSQIATERVLGSGEFGLVELGTLNRTRRVAVKQLKGSVDADTQQRFLTEAWLTGSLDHPNIVSLLAVCSQVQCH